METQSEVASAETIKQIFELLVNVKLCLRKRGTSEYENYLKKIPTSQRDRLHYLFQWGAMFCISLFEARRGGQDMSTLKVSDFAVVEDDNFKFIKRVAEEKVKYCNLEKRSDLYTCIPFIWLDDFNPGQYLEYYISCLPGEGDLRLFVKPRKRDNFNIHNPLEKVLYEANTPVERNCILKMLGDLCSLMGRPRLANHTLRSSAISYMEKAGVSSAIISKITGNLQPNNHVQNYNMPEFQGLVDVAIAVATGSMVALGEPPLKLNLYDLECNSVNQEGSDGANVQDSMKEQGGAQQDND